MKIAVNTRLLIKDKMEGIGWFTYETLKKITLSHPEHKFFFIFDRPWDESFIFSDNVSAISTKIPCRHPFLWYLWFNHSVPSILRQNNIDLFVSPDGFNVPGGIRSYMVLHDLNFVHFPKNVPYFERNYYKINVRNFIKNAYRLGTVSEFSKKDICSVYGTDPSKIDVLCNGSSLEFQPVSDVIKQEVRQRVAGGSEYFLFVGALNPRKNIGRLLKAFDSFCEKKGSAVKLVIVGEPMFSGRCYKKIYENMKHRDNVIFSGRQSRKDLGMITASALALVFPSTFEGFGIPIIEAMSCDVPVITSKNTSMKEVAGEAAFLVDPFSEESITDALINISENSSLRTQLIEKGRLQRLNYGWDKAAQLFWQGIEKCL